MARWVKYYELEPIKRLKNEGRELLGNTILLTEKRDGENVSIWLDDNNEVRISSHNLIEASADIVNRLKSTPEYHRAVSLLREEHELYDGDYILYGELLKLISPTHIEPKRKYIHWVLFDIYDCKANRYLHYNHLYQKAYHYKIPTVRVILAVKPYSMDELYSAVNLALSWCKKHKREGIVGKDYTNQIFFKEKIDIPEVPIILSAKKTVEYPPMPEERILRALQHAFDVVGEHDWMDKSKAMPIIAKYLALEAREHNYAVPNNMYKIYLDTPIEKLKSGGHDGAQ